MHRAILLFSVCSTLLLAAEPPARPLPDRDLGLSRTSVFEAPAPPPFRAEDSAPGEKPLPRRINREAPPVIPHGVSDCLPITRSSNLCMDCHAHPGPKKQGEATPIPSSHFVDLRRAPGARGKQVAGARYVCISCHVSRTDARLLVGSTFRP
jgi:nitrate reductase (cytochrome), electron transfer subunit